MKQLVLKLDVNDEQDVNIALDRIARISVKYVVTVDKKSKLCTVKGDNIDPIQIVRKLRMLCHVDIVAVEPPKEPERKKEELVGVVVNASSLAAAAGPSKEPKKEDELKKEEPTKQEELVEEFVNASSRAGVLGPSKEPKKKEEEPMQQEELVEEVVNASSLAAAIGPSKEPKKKEEELEKEEPTRQEEKKKGEEIITDVKEDPNETFRAGAMKAVFKLGLDDDKIKNKVMKTLSSLQGVDSISMDMKDKKLTVVGDNIDAVNIAGKLRKICHMEIISIGPAKEPGKKKEEPKKPEDDKKDKDAVAELVKAYQAYNPYVVEEDPNACAIS